MGRAQRHHNPSTYLQGTVVSLGSMLIIVATLPLVEIGSVSEVATLGLLAAVLWAAALGGGKPGAAAAILGALFYAALRLPSFSDDPLGTTAAVVARLIAFLAVGLAGGVLISRLKALLNSVERSGVRDLQSGVYSAAYMQQLMVLELEEHIRYKKAFAVIVVAGIIRKVDLKPVGSVLDANARASDTVGRSMDGGFLIILPQTDLDGAMIAARRIHSSSSASSEGDLKINTFAAPQHLPELRKLVGKFDEEVLDSVAKPA
jgi:hypothetical protein